jgi:hypothetical protein
MDMVISLFRFVVARGAILAVSGPFMKRKQVNKKNAVFWTVPDVTVGIIGWRLEV